MRTGSALTAFAFGAYSQKLKAVTDNFKISADQQFAVILQTGKIHYIDYSVAVNTANMVVVAQIGVVSALPGTEIKLFDHPGLVQNIEIPIHCSQAYFGQTLTDVAVKLVGRGMRLGIPELLQNYAPLICHPLHVNRFHNITH